MDGLLEDLAAPFESALARVWILGPGDQCASCGMRAMCPDRRTCLHLTWSAGLSTRLDGPFRRIPLEAAPLGPVARGGVPFLASAGLERSGLADPAWLLLHRIRSFAAIPLEKDGAPIGALGLFSRRELLESDVRALRAAGRLLALLVPARVPAASAGSGAASRTLAEIEREAIESALLHCGGRVSGPKGAARILGLKPTTLHSRMKKLGVRRRGR